MPLSPSHICQNYADEPALTKALQQGENDAFGCLFESFKDLISQMCRKFPKVGDENIKDLYMETIISIYGKLQQPEKADKEHNLGGLVNRSFFNKINEFVRNNRKFVNPTEQSNNADFFKDEGENEDDEDGYFMDGLDDPEDEQERIDTAIRKTFASTALSDDCKEIVRLKEMGGASYEEIAEDLNKKASSLKSNYRRCKDKFTEILRFYLNA